MTETPGAPIGAPAPGARPAVSAIVLRGDRVLLGLRRGAHGAGTWSFPGGKVDPGEDPATAAARELHEETGLHATGTVPVAWTDDRFPGDGLHFATLHHLVDAEGEPVEREPDKVGRWAWFRWDALPAPLFSPITALLATGWRPPGPGAPR
ncbi:nucleotide triphosphate diphosphatase NUDT15 [Nocardiopsis composta]|uniref:8-oxo-dGTP diphosphatase n=1 Tax=Nocardiopsis composta TaxID=157465 RepID=A0A7W8VBR8_9ACTN|nr:NUDIX domain-containing protein [Nocardiopsis composta]MBB5430407.1 8-oxo-dGTP diphosphatase [Nocardiopsis composta]